MEDFEGYVTARAPSLVRAAYLLTGDWGSAEDLVQETLIAVASRWAAVVRKGEPEGYVRRVMYHKFVDGWRRRRARAPEVPLSGLNRPEAAAAFEEVLTRRTVLRDALAKLTPRQRAVLVLRFYEDLTEVETARQLGCSVSTVKSQARHALGRLRELAPDVVAEFAPQAEVES